MHVWLSDDELKWLRQLADERAESLAALVRGILSSYRAQVTRGTSDER